MKLLKLCSGLLVLCLALASHSLYAARGITSDNAGPHFSGLHNQETIEDMRFKVLGGDVRMNRVWRGKHWEWNERWGQLKLMPHTTTNALGETKTIILGVYRAGQMYRKTSETAEKIVYENQLNQFITKTATEYIWTDRNGNGITYDVNGRVINYFDKNKIYVYLERDAAGEIQFIKDHHHNTVLTLTYESYTNSEDDTQPLQRIKSYTDYKGRSVVYGWNAKNQLETVTDVRGQVWTYVYSESGLLTQLKDPDNRITRYEIEESGKFISRFNADGVGERYKYSYDKEDQIYYMSKTNGAGHVEETWSNAMGQSVRDSANGENESLTAYTLSDGSSGVENIMNNYSYRVEHWYKGDEYIGKKIICPNGQDASGPDDPCFLNSLALPNKPIYVKFKKVTDARGGITTYEHDQWKNVVGVVYPDGTRTSTKYHSQFSLPVSETNEKGVITAYEYDGNGNLLVLTEAKGTDDERSTRYTYNDHGQLETKTTGKSAANNTALATTTYEYDQYGNITKVTDPENNITIYSDYDALGNAQTITDARANAFAANDQYTWKSTYDAAGNLLTKHDPYNTAETYTYTKTGDLESVISASGSKVTLTSNASGQPLTMTDDNNKVTKLEYDKAGNLTYSTDANGNKTQTHYDPQGRVVRTVDAEGNTTRFNFADNLLRNIEYPTYKEILEYDSRNRVKQTTQQANSRNYIRKRGYDVVGNQESNTDAQAKETVYSYDLLNRVKTITDAEGGVTEFSYDARDNLLQVKDPEGRLTIYTYDKNGRLVSETKGDDQNTTRQRRYEYDANGNLITTTNPEQEKTTYEFDQANRLVKTRVFANKDHAHPIKVINYPFNEKNQLTGWSQSVSDDLPEGITRTADIIPLSETYTYTNLNQIELVTVSFGSFTKTYSYTYYPNGLKKTYTNPEAITYTYYYNKNNVLMAVHIPGEGQISWTEFDWMVPQTLLLPGGQKITFKYDDFQQIKERILKKQDNTQLAKAVYEYDLEQNIKKIEKGEGVFNYGYDDLYRLTSADSPEGYAANDETFGYDGVGNRISHTENNVTETLAHNQKNQLESIESSDDIGDATFTYNLNGHTETRTKNGVTTEYIYNHEERLIEVKGNNASIAEYAYNPYGQRVKKTANGTTSWYLYNENGLAAEYSNTGQLLKEYHFHPQKTWMTDPLFQRTVVGEVYYYHNDQLDTPQQMVDAEGNVVWNAQYSAFGKAHVTINAAKNNLRFPGQYYDSETELYHNYRRDYNSESGRYIESDPIGLMGGLNLFIYVGSNPIYKKDPMGKQQQEADDYTPCAYYDQVAKDNKCKYHEGAAKICRGENTADSVGANNFLKMCSYLSSKVSDGKKQATATVRNCIRRCLVASDKSARQKPECQVPPRDCQPGNAPGGGCTANKCIDEYHNKCFESCGVSTNCYGGNYPYPYTNDDPFWKPTTDWFRSF